jgi:hypothetical protein
MIGFRDMAVELGLFLVSALVVWSTDCKWGFFVDE